MEFSTEVEGEEPWAADAAEEVALAQMAEGHYPFRGHYLPIHFPLTPTPKACFFSKQLEHHFSKFDAL